MTQQQCTTKVLAGFYGSHALLAFWKCEDSKSMGWNVCKSSQLKMWRSFEESSFRAFRFYLPPCTAFFSGHFIHLMSLYMHECCEHPSFWKLQAHRINIPATYELTRNLAIDCMNISFVTNINLTQLGCILLQTPASCDSRFPTNPDSPAKEWLFVMAT